QANIHRGSLREVAREQPEPIGFGADGHLLRRDRSASGTSRSWPFWFGIHSIICRVLRLPATHRGPTSHPSGMRATGCIVPGILGRSGRYAQGTAWTDRAMDEESPATPWEREASDDSRGGTRTRDPGIMSAVL